MIKADILLVEITDALAGQNKRETKCQRNADKRPQRVVFAAQASQRRIDSAMAIMRLLCAIPTGFLPDVGIVAVRRGSSVNDVSVVLRRFCGAG